MNFSHHIISFSLSLIVLTVVFFIHKNNYINNYFKDKSLNTIESHYIAKYSADIESELMLSDFMCNSNGIMLLGSSELGTSYDSSQIPYKFFNATSSTPPLVAFGHAGNQSLAIMSELMANSCNIKNSKLVFIISPSWFEEGYSKGTSLQSFLESTPEFNLNRIYFNKNIQPQFKNYLYQYVLKNSADIVGASSILRLYSASAGNGTLFSFQIWMNEFNAKTRYTQQQILEDKYYADGFSKKQQDFLINNNIKKERCIINWDSLNNEAVKYHQRISTNNNLGIYNEYYAKHIEGHNFEVKVVPLNENQEFKDFKMLVHYLKSNNNTEALFIISPLHQKIYKGMDKLTSTINEVEKHAVSNGYKVYNMWNDKPSAYKIGILRDPMHIGEVGWNNINKVIYNHFVKKENN